MTTFQIILECVHSDMSALFFPPTFYYGRSGMCTRLWGTMMEEDTGLCTFKTFNLDDCEN